MHICVSSTICKRWSNRMLLCIHLYICIKWCTTQYCTNLHISANAHVHWRGRVFVQGAHLCDLYEVVTCACTFAHCACAAPLDCILSGQLHMHMFIATQLEMKWSGICALLSTGHRSNVAWHWTQCGTLWYTLWYTLAHFLILHTLAHIDTAHFGTGHWHTESSHRSSVAWQPPAETQHSESLLIDTLEPEFWKHKNHIGDRSCAKLFKSLCSKLQSHLGTY